MQAAKKIDLQCTEWYFAAVDILLCSSCYLSLKSLQNHLFDLSIAMLSEPFPADTWRRCLAAFQALAPGSRVKISVAAAQSVLETFSVSLGDKPKELEEVCGLDRDAQTGSDPIHVIRIESAACDQDLEIILSASRGTSSLTAWQHLTDALQTHDRTLRDVLGAQLARIKSAVQLNSYAGVLDYMPKPAFLINHRKRVVCSNEVGERVVREGQCVRYSSDRQLQMLDGAANRQLDEGIADSLEKGLAAAKTRIVRFECTRGLEHSLKFQPLRHANGSTSVEIPHLAMPFYLLTFQLSDSFVEISPPVVRELFGVTPAAAKLVAALAQGQSLVDYCEHAGIKIATGRWHLHTALQKTNCANQPELVARVLHGVL